MLLERNSNPCNSLISPVRWSPPPNSPGVGVRVGNALGARPREQFGNRGLPAERAAFETQLEQVGQRLAHGGPRRDSQHPHNLIAVDVGPDAG